MSLEQGTRGGPWAAGSGGPFLIGMVHLLPLPGSPLWGGSIDEVMERAARDTVALTEAGFDAVLVENFLDTPFYPGRAPAVTVSALTRAVLAVRAQTTLPVGINLLRNDAEGALGIASATGAAFIRVNVHTGAMWTDQGLIEGSAHETLRQRRALGAPVAILADVHVKHATPPLGSSLVRAAEDTWHRGLADGLVLSGTGTGKGTDPKRVVRIRQALPAAPLFIGSGIREADGRELLDLADGAIVGTSIMNGGRAGAGIDPARASELVRVLRRP